MLQSLYIKNFAIIDELRVNFKDGLNIITGETGAGKSLIIKAIQFLLGERFTGEVLRTGTDQMVIEGVFGKNDAETTIRRLYRSGGQSKSFINEEPVRQKDFLKVTRKLIDLHGQHDHQNLLDAKTHIQYLDAFGRHSDDLIVLKCLFNKMQFCQNTLNNLKKEQIKLEEKQELHNFQLKELSLYPLNEEYEQKITKQYNDTDKIDHNASIEELFEEQLEVSDIILVSRSDILNDHQFDVVKNKIQETLNSSTPIVKSKNGKIDLNYLFDFNLKKETYKKFLTEEHDHNHVELVSDSIKLNYFLEKNDFEKEMSKILDELNILRIKGRIWIPNKSLPLQIQIVGKKINTWFEEAPDNCWRPNDNAGLELVIISFDERSTKILNKKIFFI